MACRLHHNPRVGGASPSSARAVFGEPALLVLDEPNTNLDAEGELGLLRCIAELKRRGCTMLIVAHQPNVLRAADKILVLRDGHVEKFGPRDEVLKSLVKAMPAARQAQPKVTPASDVTSSI